MPQSKYKIKANSSWQEGSIGPRLCLHNFSKGAKDQTSWLLWNNTHNKHYNW